MFAIAIFDEPAEQLTLVRDRNGIKPLYYYRDERNLFFASELKAILALLPQRPAISPRALREYLRWKFIPSPLTIYEGIFELPPGHRLCARRNAAAGRLDITVERYWEPDYSEPKLTNENEAVDQLDRLLRAAVESHLESDVEVGALLSGGVDSSLVVALASQLSGRRLKTFTVGFHEEGFDQLPFARVLAKRYNTDHYEEYVDFDPMTAVPKLVRHFDQPFADSSALACYRVCEVASRHVKVALTGDGGDETFAGYRRYADLLHASEHETLCGRAMRGAVYAAGAAIFSPEAKFLSRYRGGFGPALEQYKQREIMCTDWLIDRLLTEPYRHERHGSDGDLFDEQLQSALSRGWSDVDAAQYTDSRLYLPGDILAKVDRTSMAWSLECRVPLLDHSITAFGAGLSLDLKIRDGVPKYLLKRVAERYVPHELLYRKKRGFRIPIRRWFKRGLLDETAKLLLEGELVARGILDPAGIRWVVRNQRRPWINLYSALWALLFLEHWARAS
jgi:asparagine synthase (glutamine-hydrolysing)